MNPAMKIMPDAYRITVLSGGNSSEREISLLSGQAVSRALAGLGHVVRQIDPARIDLRTADWSRCDVAFIALHGQFGEDGQVQSLLEGLGVPYTGSDATASQRAFNKIAAKERFRHEGLLTPAFVPIHESDNADAIGHHARALGYPLVVKPNAQGSSLGVTIVNAPDHLAAALSRSFHFDPVSLLEQAIVGEEWTVGVIDDRPLPPIRIDTCRMFFDYRAKYEDEQTEYHFAPHALSTLTHVLEQTGLAACHALRVRGIARVDIRVDSMGRPWILEVNTVPGFTDHSLVPKAAAKAGIPLATLCDMAVRRVVTVPSQRTALSAS